MTTEEPAATAGAATPRPWRQEDRGPANDFNEWHFIQGEGNRRRIVRASYDDAALIVAAVNDYDRLCRIEAAARAALNELGVPGEGYPAPVANAVDLLRAALQPTPTEGRQP